MGASGHDDPFVRDDRPLVWAHRGASARAPESSAEAFALAAGLGADGAECDVMLCGSGELVVCHDERLDRLCGVPLLVRETPLGALRELRLLAARFPESRAITPTLEEAVEAAGPSLRWNVELKVDRHADAEPVARAAVREIRRMGLGARVLVSSFHPHALLTVRRVAPELPTAWLFEERTPRLWNELWLRLGASRAVHPPAAAVTPAAVTRWHDAGRVVNAWTVDDPAEARRLAAAGVDGVITNVPDVALAALRSGRPSRT